MTDKIIDLLESFEIRFDANGHDVAISRLQTEVVGKSILVCKECDERAIVVVVNRHYSWELPATKLDEPCRGVQQ